MFHPFKKVAAGVAALAALALGGAAIADAASSSSTTATASSGTPTQRAFPAHGSAAHEDAEKPVTGTVASKAQAAAVKAVGSGTAGAVTTDFSQKGYKVEVHLDSAFQVMPGPGGGHGAPPSGAAPAGPGPAPAGA
jgi:hypothetical protein